ncbi:NfeD family protein [Allorhizocola rhizosphaerae]|uniref:NfeD family protein n=1 Tax=Allorhizocola rhizosphaerae TaxID=1872709 RepID=UPI000E3EA119|nr:NfeD family protein [Allorhizocola rhizosphaerae]
MSLATTIFLVIGAVGVLIALLAVFGGTFFDFGDGLFSVEAAAGFAGGLGFGAAAVHELIGDEIGPYGSLGVGVIIAVPVSFLATRLVARMQDMPTDATPTAGDLVGTKGVVVTPIPAGGYGEVRVRIGGQPMKLYARAGKPIALGASVVVTQALSETNVLVMEE